MGMPGRSFSSGAYRYGFNGKENDNEISGTGNKLDFGARIYDSRLGRWFTPDKMTKEAPAMSPFAFVDNSPLAAIDPDGNRTYFIGGAGYNPNPSGLGKLITKLFAPNGTFTSETQKAFSGILGDEFLMVKNSTGDKNMAMVSNSYWSLLKGSQPVLNIENEAALMATVKEITDDYAINGKDENGKAKPLNLMGSSYGSVMAAQVAVEILSHPEKYGNIKITSVTLSASPVNEKSDLFKKLEEFRKAGTLGDIIPDPNDNDAVSGSAGTSPKEGKRNFFKLIFSENSILFPRHPHNRAAKDTKRAYDRMLRKTVGAGTEGDANQAKAQELIKEKVGG
jgi:RHS repeat-associated protein